MISQHKFLREALFWLLFVNEAAWFYYRHFGLKVPIQNNLPLHLCDLSVFLALLGLIFWKSSFLRSACYFIGIPGALVAMAFPEISETGWIRWIATIRFFLTHGLLIVTGFYMTFGLHFQPSLKNLWQSFGLMTLWMAFVYPINLWLGTNYMFLMSKPGSVAFLKNLSQPEFIIFGLLVSLVFYFALFGISRRIKS